MDKWLNSDTFVKMMSVVLAILLYIAVNDSQFGLTPSSQTMSTVIRDVSVEPRFDNERFATVITPQTVNLTLRGNSFLVSRAVSSNYRVYVDLTRFGPGPHRNVPVKVEGLPEGVDFVTDPPSVNVELEEKLRKEMAAETEVVGQPKKGYSVGTPIVKPEKVLVRAIESRLEEVAAVKAVVNVNGATETVKETVPLMAYNEKGEVMEDVEIDEREAQVEVPIISPSKDVPLQPQIEKWPPKDFAVAAIEVSEDVVTVFGDESVIGGMGAYPGPPLDLSEVTKDWTLIMPIPLIKGVEKVDPKTVRLDVEIVPAEKETFKALPVRVNGKQSGWNVRFLNEDDKAVSVTLSGAPERLRRIERQDVRPVIDVSQLKPGTYDLEIEWDLPLYVRPIGEKKTVRVELSDGS